MYKKNFLRNEKCTKCQYCSPINIKNREIFCRKKDCFVKITEGNYCERFVIQKNPVNDELSKFGYRNRFDRQEDWRTARQWNQAGRKIKKGAKGEDMHPIKGSPMLYTYYLIEDTEEI